MIESEHRAIGRQIGWLLLADNWAFAPVLVTSVADAPIVIANAGFLSPSPGNRFEYHPVPTSNPVILHKSPLGKENDMAVQLGTSNAARSNRASGA